MATVGTAGGHQLLRGIADDLQPPRSQLLGVVFTRLWHHHRLSRVVTAPSPNLRPWGRAMDTEQTAYEAGLIHATAVVFDSICLLAQGFSTIFRQHRKVIAKADEIHEDTNVTNLPGKLTNSKI